MGNEEVAYKVRQDGVNGMIDELRAVGSEDSAEELVR